MFQGVEVFQHALRHEGFADRRFITIKLYH